MANWYYISYLLNYTVSSLRVGPEVICLCEATGYLTTSGQLLFITHVSAETSLPWGSHSRPSRRHRVSYFILSKHPKFSSSPHLLLSNYLCNNLTPTFYNACSNTHFLGRVKHTKESIFSFHISQPPLQLVGSM